MGNVRNVRNVGVRGVENLKMREQVAGRKKKGEKKEVKEGTPILSLVITHLMPET